MKILLAGATGGVGRATLARLRTAGHWVRTLSRDAKRAATLGALGANDVRVADAARALPADLAAGVDAVISCLGGNLGLSLAERRSYARVDLAANRRLLAAARAAGVKRFIYVSLTVGPRYANTRYVRAHERFVEELRASELSATVIRPTGIFPALMPFLDMARRGRIFVAGNGQTRTNPISPGDVASAIVDALAGDATDIPVGGPEILLRDDLARAAFTAVKKPAKITHVPVWLFAFGAFFLRLIHPRLSDLLQFVAAVSSADAVAPQVGRDRVADFFQSQAKV